MSLSVYITLGHARNVLFSPRKGANHGNYPQATRCAFTSLALDMPKPIFCGLGDCNTRAGSGRDPLLDLVKCVHFPGLGILFCREGFEPASCRADRRNGQSRPRGPYSDQIDAGCARGCRAGGRRLCAYRAVADRFPDLGIKEAKEPKL
jgi:hypothetical protein